MESLSFPNKKYEFYDYYNTHICFDNYCVVKEKQEFEHAECTHDELNSDS